MSIQKPVESKVINKKQKKGLISGALTIVGFFLVVYSSHKLGFLLGQITQQIGSVGQTLQTYSDYRDKKIDYQTLTYVLSGRGSQPSGIDLTLLIGIQRAEGDLTARDKTLLIAMKGNNSMEIMTALHAGRDVFDEDYREELNATSKKSLSEKAYDKLVKSQVTTLTSSQLDQMKACYKLSYTESTLKQLYSYAYNNRPSECQLPTDQSDNNAPLSAEKRELSLMLSNGDRKVVKVIDATSTQEDNKSSQPEDSLEATDDLHTQPSGEQQTQP